MATPQQSASIVTVDMQGLAAFNELAPTQEEYVTCAALQEGVSYSTDNFHFIDTRFGKRVLVHVKDGASGESKALVLPERYNRLSQQTLESYNSLSLAGFAP